MKRDMPQVSAEARRSGVAGGSGGATRRGSRRRAGPYAVAVGKTCPRLPQAGTLIDDRANPPCRVGAADGRPPPRILNALIGAERAGRPLHRVRAHIGLPAARGVSSYHAMPSLAPSVVQRVMSET